MNMENWEDDTDRENWSTGRNTRQCWQWSWNFLLLFRIIWNM